MSKLEKKAPNKKVPVKKSKEPVENEVVVKGISDHVVKQGSRNNTLVAGEVRVGISKGATLNLGNYQSARIDFWMERVVNDNEHDITKAYAEMGEELDTLLEEEANSVGIALGGK